MNKYIRAMYCVPCGLLKMTWTKLFHFRTFKGPVVSLVSPLTEITMDRDAKLHIGNGFKMRDGAKIRVRKGANCIIGKNVSINSNNMIACHENIVIGDNVQMSPGVQIYDHDHDFRVEGGVGAMKYKTSPVVIGDNVWIGAGTTILRGTQIGKNSVIAAGCVIKGSIADNSIVIQERTQIVKKVYRY